MRYISNKFFLLFLSFFAILIPFLFSSPVKVIASTCINAVPLSSQQFGYVGGPEFSSSLQTSLWYGYDFLNGTSCNKSIFMIGKRWQGGWGDPSGLKLLMGQTGGQDNLVNYELSGALVSDPTTGWILQDTFGGSTASLVSTPSDAIHSTSDSIEDTSLVTNPAYYQVTSGTNNQSGYAQLTQIFKQPVTAGQHVLFGAWIKTDDPSAVRVTVQSPDSPYTEFGDIDGNISTYDLNSTAEPNPNFKANVWNFVTGYGTVPSGVTRLQLILRVTKPGKTVKFDSAVAAVVESSTSPAIQSIVNQRKGGVWFVDNEPGFEGHWEIPGNQSCTSTAELDKWIKAITPQQYALQYYAFNRLIRAYDTSSSVKVLNGGLSQGSGCSWYDPLTFIDDWRSAYATFFSTNTGPAIDALNVHWYFGTDVNAFAEYIKNYRIRLDGLVGPTNVTGWNAKPIWVSETGTSNSFTDQQVSNTAQSLINYAKGKGGTTQKLEKLFWFDTCGYDSVKPLFSNCSTLTLSATGSTWANHTYTYKNPSTGDYTFQNKTNVTVYRPSNAGWYVKPDTNARYISGTYGYYPVPADYDGDGKTDIAMWNANNGIWNMQYSSAIAGNVGTFTFGQSGDIPVPADYDGDGRADIAIFRPSAGDWYVYGSTAGQFIWGTANNTGHLGQSGDIPVPGDYDGDGKADIGVYRPSEGNWYVQRTGSEPVSQRRIIWGTTNDTGHLGQSGDKIAPGDYDGDGKTDIGVFRPSEGNWYVERTGPEAVIYRRIIWGATGNTGNWGQSGDLPAVSSIVLNNIQFFNF